MGQWPRAHLAGLIAVASERVPAQPVAGPADSSDHRQVGVAGRDRSRRLRTFSIAIGL